MQIPLVSEGANAKLDEGLSKTRMVESQDVASAWKLRQHKQVQGRTGSGICEQSKTDAMLVTETSKNMAVPESPQEIGVCKFSGNSKTQFVMH